MKSEKNADVPKKMCYIEPRVKRDYGIGDGFI